MSLTPDTVAIPFTSGIKPNTRARLLEPAKLQAAVNCFYQLNTGPQKRNGHTTRTVRTGVDYTPQNFSEPTGVPLRDTFSTADLGLAGQNWLYGWGERGSPFDAGEVQLGSDPYEVSQHPNVGLLFGGAVRDSEVLAWDGFRLFSYSPNSDSGKFGEAQGATISSGRLPATMPALRATPMGKIAGSQLQPCGADNGVLRVVSWLNADGVTGGYSVFDAGTRAGIVINSVLTYQAPKHMKLISTGPWFHIIVSDPTANLIDIRSFHQDTPSTVITHSLGTCDNVFDAKKVSENQFIVAKLKAGVITVFVLNADATTAFSWIPNLNGLAANTNTAIAIEFDGQDTIGLVWQNGVAPATVYFARYRFNGAAIFLPLAVSTLTAANGRVTVSARVVSQDNLDLKATFDVFLEDTVSSVKQVRSYAVAFTGPATAIATRHRVVLGSHAFRVGNRNFLWCANWLGGGTALQTTWFLCDAALLPVGKMDYGAAAADLTGTAGVLPGVNWTSTAASYRDRVVFHGAMPFNLRVASAGTASGAAAAQPSGVFSETSIRFFELDFLPTLRSAQAGRTTYFAGAQLWAYDGAEVVEAGFHQAPEGVTGVAGAGGSLSAGDYRYRVDLCHKNAQNEEVRSWSLITPKVTVAGGQKITLTIPQVPMTRREDAYFLIFRTEANGTIYYLANSRDPASANYLKNNPATATFTYVDTLADTTLISGEYHPANSGGNYVDPLPAPACEIVAAGRDRLWLAGGELAPGEVAPSRLFFPGQSPAFSPALNIQVDRNAEPITAIGFTGELAAVFRRTSVYVLDADGPDNNLQGAWLPPRLAVADSGAVSQEGLAVTSVGLWFQAPAGLRLLGPGGTVVSGAGHDVNPLVATSVFAGTVVVPQYSQIRWYSRDPAQPTVVYNYVDDSWSTWTVSCVNAVFWPTTDLAVLVRRDGKLWTESPTVFNDAGSTYEMRVKLSWLHAGNSGDFQRVRRIALFGQAQAPLNLRIRYFYDERDFHEEEQIVVFPGTGSGTSEFNQSGWGDTDGGLAVLWGSGSWGDAEVNDTADFQAAGQSSLWFRDKVFRLRKRPARQKCSVFSVEFSDQGVDGPGFVPVVLALELARKTGLDRAAPSNS